MTLKTVQEIELQLERMFERHRAQWLMATAAGVVPVRGLSGTSEASESSGAAEADEADGAGAAQDSQASLEWAFVPVPRVEPMAAAGSAGGANGLDGQAAGRSATAWAPSASPSLSTWRCR